MKSSFASTSFAILCGLTLATAGCGGSPGPKSTTTTRTQTTVENDTGESTSTDVQQTTTEQADGSQDVERTETSKHSTPPTTP